MKKPKSLLKTYVVNIMDMVSTDITVKAKNSREAKKKAWKKFRPKKQNFQLLVIHKLNQPKP